MTIIYYETPANIRAGITFKSEQQLEQFNTALHACESKEAIQINRGKLAKSVSQPLEHFVFANQTHSANFQKLTKEHVGSGIYAHEDAIQDVDAMYTFEPNIVCTSLTADCVPILFYSEKCGLVGAIHSGWGGTVKEITNKLFEHLQTNEQVDLKHVQVHIGRALSKEKFEVDEDVASKFLALGYADEWISFKNSSQKYHIDNQLVVKKQCEIAGVPTENITIDRTCTFNDKRSFSYRENRQCGRHVSFIVREEE